MTPRVTSVEYDLTKPGMTVAAWVTVSWGPDDEMKIPIGKVDPTKIGRPMLIKKAQDALRKLAKDFAEIIVE